MDGYSVTEAASVLGVPTERVWELLARGVLAGAAEGETGMRVYLHPRPTQVAAAASDDPRGNGHERDRDREEASPFRELLTEFRNLTERYGQALLALGEARGEVASLRGRVELLEARFDLRLPGGSPMPDRPAAAWTPPPVAEPTAPRVEQASDPAAAHDADPAADEHPQTEDGRRRRRRRGQHPASDEIAEALARADDPSPAELPGAAEAAAAFASLREESETADVGELDAVLPRELPAAEAMDLVDEIVSPPEPEPVEVEPEPVAVEPEPVEVEPEPVAAEFEPAAAEPIETATDTVGAEATADVGRSADEPIADLGDEAPEPWDRERYSAAIEEPDWIPEEVERPAAAGDPEPWPSIIDDRSHASSTGAEEQPPSGDDWPAEPDLVHRREIEQETSMWRSTIGDARERLGLEAEPEPTESEADPDEPATDEAAAEMEVAGSGPAPVQVDDGPPATPDVAAAPEPPAAVARPGPAAAPMPTIGTTGTASRAYRRLRRIFPG